MLALIDSYRFHPLPVRAGILAELAGRKKSAQPQGRARDPVEAGERRAVQRDRSWGPGYRIAGGPRSGRGPLDGMTKT